MSHPITVVGIGDDGLDGLSVSARALLDDATFIVGALRHLEMLSADDTRDRLQWSKDLAGDIEKFKSYRDTHKICVLATGDPLMHGIAVQLIARYGSDQVDVHPSPSAFSLAAARMGWSLNKKSITLFPYNIGIISALEGAAIQDILQTFKLDNLIVIFRPFSSNKLS